MSALIPTRDPNALSGSDFISTIMNLTGQQREDKILEQLESGNIPDFLRKFVPVTISENNNTLTYLVMPDCLAIGNDENYMRIPTFPHTAKIIADKFDCALPTKKMVDDIWKAAENKILPKPYGAPYDIDIIRTHRYQWINDKINEQMVGKDKSKLTAGGKKDIIISKSVAPNNSNRRVVIYGWFNANGSVIQSVNDVDHDSSYVDYSHKITLVAQDVMLNGNVARFYDILNDKQYSYLLSYEGPYNASNIYK